MASRGNLEFPKKIKHNAVGTFVSGGSFSFEDSVGNPYWLLAKADETSILYDNTDPNDPISKTLAVDDLANVTNNQLFIEKDSSGNIIQTAFYAEALDSECSLEVKKFMNLVEKAIDSNGDYAIDSNGAIAYAPKEGVVFE